MIEKKQNNGMQQFVKSDFDTMEGKAQRRRWTQVKAKHQENKRDLQTWSVIPACRGFISEPVDFPQLEVEVCAGGVEGPSVCSS